MMEVKDLNMESIISAFFDYTNNPYSKKILEDLFTCLPRTTDEIYERQGIIKGCIMHWDELRNFSYLRIELEEVYRFSTTIEEDGSLWQKNKIASISEWFLSKQKKYRKRSQYIQMINFFDRLYLQYFKKMDDRVFPDTLKAGIDLMKQFLKSFSEFNKKLHQQNSNFSLSLLIDFEKMLRGMFKDNKINSFWEKFFLLDAYISIARGVKNHNFNFPVFNESAFLIKGFYHPLIKDPVKNDLLAVDNVILITGPNMSGKSTLLKSIGLCIYLAHTGFGVPAGECEIPFFRHILISINLKDDLQNGYSHFMTEVKQLKQIVVDAINGDRCLGIFDELYRGTNIDDALDISKMTVKGLTQFKKSCFLISTHLYQLKAFIEEERLKIGTYYLECILNDKNPSFSYHLKMGWSDLRIGRIIFENEGLNKLLQ
jgi:DNA mismatch repair protein MutS